MMQVEITEQHKWLERLLGEWEFEMETPGEAGKEPTKSKGTEVVKSLGGVWIVAEGIGDMCGSPMHSLMTLSYDAEKGAFVGTWVGSMMVYLWVYRGELDESGKSLTLSAEGPSWEDPKKMRNYRDIIEFVDDDHRFLRSEMQQEDGTWKEFMRLPYRRKSSDGISAIEAAAPIA